MSDEELYVWVFCGEGARFPAAVFSSRATAETWIAANHVSGVLTAYPMDESSYDWAVRKGFFKPKTEVHAGPKFIQRFSSAYQKHVHYFDGRASE